jgi:TatD DNase family protein
MFFESHAHYNDKQYDEDRHPLIDKLLNTDISYIINIGASMESSKTSLELTTKYDKVFTSVGVHPHSVKDMTDADIELLEKYCSYKKVVAIGEIGLDFFYDYSPRDIQKHWFVNQLELAKRVNLPVVIHARDASSDVFDIISSSSVRNGVIHCYSGSAKMAKEYINMGFYIGVGGVVTFSNAKKLVDVVDQISIHNIVIETDAPYLSPVPHRGSRNDSSNLQHIASKIAEIKNISVEEVIDITRCNGKKLFNI